MSNRDDVCGNVTGDGVCTLPSGHPGAPNSCGGRNDAGADALTRPEKPCSKRLPGNVWCFLPPGHDPPCEGPAPRDMPRSVYGPTKKDPQR